MTFTFEIFLFKQNKADFSNNSFLFFLEIYSPISLLIFNKN